MAVGESVIEDGADGSGAGADANCSLQPVDLTERGDSAARHPWEVQRFEAYRRILADHGVARGPSRARCRCRRRWFSDRLAEHLAADATVIVCWDVNYHDDDLEPTSARRRREPVNDPGRAGDLVLLLDVLEHIEEPAAFIRTMPVADRRARRRRCWSRCRPTNGCSAPTTWRSGHERRYGRGELLDQLAPWIDVADVRFAVHEPAAAPAVRRSPSSGCRSDPPGHGRHTASADGPAADPDHGRRSSARRRRTGRSAGSAVPASDFPGCRTGRSGWHGERPRRRAVLRRGRSARHGRPSSSSPRPSTS